MKSPEHQKRSVTEYVELEARGEKVKRAEKVASERNFDLTHDVWDVETDKDRYWVITEPTNLYSHSDFPSMDYALSFHIGLMSRMNAGQHTNATDEDIYRTPKTWRQWEQAHDALELAEEAEDFQGVGARCREVLITLVDELETSKLTKRQNPDIKRADVKAQLAATYDLLASGKEARKIRAHLKTNSDSTWELVSWLTHHKNAVREDAKYVMNATEQLMLNTLSIVVRSEKSKPKRCPKCKSYRVISDFRSELMYKVEHPYVELCEACGWGGNKPK
ncbi:MAG: hypothetical protein Q7S45_03160 [Candidatus Curtissbacteria bacterium]|nr:hypothetical protein [Candidatus Curtissbacteria bacterium]